MNFFKKILLPIFFLAAITTQAQRPNIVFILCDDLGYNDLGFNGATDIPTPNIDALATGGTVFTDSYAVHPFCGPSRMGLLSGRYPHEFGGQYNLPDTDNTGLGLPTSEVLFSKVLQDAGYYTALVGKWHLGEPSQYHPNNRGFDDFYGYLNGGHTYFPHPKSIDPENDDENPHYKGAGSTGWVYNRALEYNGGPVVADGNYIIADEEYITDVQTDQGVNFIKKAKAIQDGSATDEPFFLFMSYNAPHTPMDAKKSDKEVAVIKDITDPDRKIYAAMVYAVDRGVKKIVDELTAQGMINNTLIVITSDNGGKTSTGASNAPLKGAKGDALEGGVRVPMLFYWPGNVPSNATYSYPITALDFYPTFTALAETNIPNGKDLDGFDIMDHVINGTNARPNDEAIHFVRHDENQTSNGIAGSQRVGIRSGKWKLYKYNNSGNFRLYDMDTDIGETTDVAGANPDVVERLEKLGLENTLGHIDPLFADNPNRLINWVNNDMPHYEHTFVGVTLSVENIDLISENNISVYPNPFESKINIYINKSSGKKVVTSILDVNGKVVVSPSLSEIEQDLFTLEANIAPGVYILQVEIDGVPNNYRIVKN